MPKPIVFLSVLAPVALAAAILVTSAPPARAGQDRVPPVANAAYKKECGDCHMAFQPQFLAGNSWRAVMGGLADHFGENAALPDAARTEILDYLLANAGGGRRVENAAPASTPALRITDLAWWKKEHAPRKITDAAWLRPSIGSKANCAACHPAAEKGDYDEHAVRIPAR